MDFSISQQKYITRREDRDGGFVLNSNLTKSFLFKLQHCSEGHLADFFFFDNERV